MAKPSRIGVALVAIALFTSGCYGPFLLTRKVHQWNGEVSDNKWIVETVFIVCAWLPVYGIATLADAIIFNSVEFWTGNNPLQTSAEGATVTKRIVRGESEATVRHRTTAAGDELFIEQVSRGQRQPGLQVRRQGEQTVAYDEAGRLLFRARTLPDGQVVVSDASGKVIASYSSEQAQHVIASVPRR